MTGCKRSRKKPKQITFSFTHTHQPLYSRLHMSILQHARGKLVQDIWTTVMLKILICIDVYDYHIWRLNKCLLTLFGFHLPKHKEDFIKKFMYLESILPFLYFVIHIFKHTRNLEFRSSPNNGTFYVLGVNVNILHQYMESVQLVPLLLSSLLGVQS